MPRLLIGWLLQTRTHGRQVQEVIVLPAHNDPRSTSGKEIDQRSGSAIQTVQTRQDVAEGKRKRAGIALDRCSGSQQFPPVIASAGVAERAQPLVRMRLQDRRSRAGDFSPFASQVAGSCDQLKAAMGQRQVCALGKCPKAHCLFCAIDIHHGPLATLPIPHPTSWGSERRSRHQIFLKEYAQCLHRCLLKGREIAGKRRRMRQVCSAKQRHERLGKRKESVIKGLQRAFPAHGVAKEHHHKINHFVVPHTGPRKPHALLDGFLQAQLAEYMRQHGHFSQPRRCGWKGCWGNLDMD